MRFRVILLNLKDEKNDELRQKIILGDITPKDLSIIDETVLFLYSRNWQVHKLEKKFMKKKNNLEN